MISEYRNIKFLHLYDIFDIDSSGSLTKEDFELLLEKISEKQQWEKDSLKYKTMQDAIQDIWDSLQKEADSDGDGEISREEWLAMWETFDQNPSSPFEWQNMYCKFYFDLHDCGEDGAIDSDKFTAVLEAFGSSKEDAELAFTNMVDEKTSVSWEEFQEMWKDYFISDDGDDPGNFIFGLCKTC